MALADAEAARRRAIAWAPPAALLAAASRRPPVHYDPAPAGLDHQLAVTPGIRTLTAAVRARWPALVYETYAPGRSLAAGNRLSVHHTGRAVDFMVHEVRGAPDRRADAIADWLLANAEPLGVQLVIWSGAIWNANAPGRVALYTGTEDHGNHLHVELTEEAAAGAIRVPASSWALAAVGAAAAAGAFAAARAWLRRSGR